MEKESYFTCVSLLAIVEQLKPLWILLEMVLYILAGAEAVLDHENGRRRKERFSGMGYNLCITSTYITGVGLDSERFDLHAWLDWNGIPNLWF